MMTCLFSCSSACAVEFGETGPLRIRDQFLLNMGLLAFDPDAASVLMPGQSRIELIETASNTFAMSGAMRDGLDQRTGRGPVTLADLQEIPGNNFYLDAEVYRTAVSFDHAVADGVQFGVSLQWLSFVGGSLDGFIENFHDTFGFDQGGREGVPRGGYATYVRSGGLEVFDEATPGSAAGDIVLRYKANLGGDPVRSPISLQAMTKLPLGDGDDLFSSGSFDFGVEVLGGYYPSPWFCFHYSLGVLRLGAWKLFDLPSQTLLSGMTGFEFGLSPSSSVIAQVTVSQSPFADLDLPELGAVSLQASLGLKHEYGRKWVLFGALTENVINFDNTADVGLHVGISRLI
ncbi:MAG: DUF3187 family protein [Gammaproteobacteria bacterium]|nr:DUF3187 family protein [Gammaproteobacteria bacterium]